MSTKDGKMTNYGPLENVAMNAYGSGWTGWGTCPNCGTRGQIDRDQYEGKVSVDCPECDYHETHDHREDDGG